MYLWKYELKEIVSKIVGWVKYIESVILKNYANQWVFFAELEQCKICKKVL